MEPIVWRNVWCKKFTPSQLDGKAPAAYRKARWGEDRSPGLYGEGFAGEAVVCLLPDDSGVWFREIAAACSGGSGCRHEAKS